MKQRGARLHPNSGAGRIKFDGSDDDILYEHKDARRSFTLSSKYLLNFWRVAIRQKKQAVFIVSMDDVIVECHIKPKHLRSE